MLMEIFCFLFFVVFPVYAIGATLIMGPIGILASFVSILQTSRRVTILLLNMIFIGRIQDVMFDAILNREGLYELTFDYNRNKESKTGSTNTRMWLTHRVMPGVTRGLLYFVLDMVPIIGPLIFVYSKAPTKTYKSHKRDYKLMRWNHRQIQLFSRKVASHYSAFGVVALLLEMIPGMTVFFMFTSNIGLALWTVDNHKRFQSIVQEQDAKEHEGGMTMSRL